MWAKSAGRASVAESCLLWDPSTRQTRQARQIEPSKFLSNKKKRDRKASTDHPLCGQQLDQCTSTEMSESTQRTNKKNSKLDTHEITRIHKASRSLGVL